MNPSNLVKFSAVKTYDKAARNKHFKAFEVESVEAVANLAADHAITPFLYKEGANKRRENITGRGNLIVIDIDTEAPDPDTLTSILQTLNWRCALVKSRSFKPDGPFKYHLFIVADRLLDHEAYSDFVLNVIAPKLEANGITLDRNAVRATQHMAASTGKAGEPFKPFYVNDKGVEVSVTDDSHAPRGDDNNNDFQAFENAIVREQIKAISADTVRDMLEAIGPIEAYKPWLEVGMALHHWSPDGEGFKIFDEWSKTAGNYDPKAVKEKWKNGFRNEDKKVRKKTLWTVMAMAKANGWSPENMKVSSLPRLWWDVKTELYYIRLGGEIYRIRSRASVRQTLTSSGLSVKEANNMINFCLNLGSRFDPTTTEQLLDGRHVNTFRPTRLMLLPRPAGPVEIPPITDKVLRNVIPIAEEREHFLNWLAHIFQTREKTQTAWILKGAQGTGKGLVSCQMLEPLFGDAFQANVDENDLSARWTWYLEDKVIVQMNEITMGERSSRSHIANKLKAFITEDVIKIEKKNQNSYVVKNFANIIINSNHSAPIEIAPRDRRFNVVVTSSTPLIEYDWFGEIAQGEGIVKAIRDESEQFARFLLAYSVDRDKANRAMDNEAKMTVANLTTETVELMAAALAKRDYDALVEIGFDEEALATFDNEDDLKELKKYIASGKIPNEVVMDIYRAISSNTNVTPTYISRRLSGLSMTKKEKNIPYKGKRVRGWVFGS